MQDRRDRCELPQGVLFSGGLALITGGDSWVGCLVTVDSGLHASPLGEYFKCTSRTGVGLFVEKKNLMPVSIKDWDDKTELDTFLYEARFGV